MYSFVYENVAAEKVEAMNKFERRKILWKFLPAIEVVVAVLVLFSWFTPSLLSSEYLRRIISGGFSNGVIIFAVVNVLIALIFSLSNQQKLTEPDFYSQYVSSVAAGEARPMKREMVRAMSSVTETAHTIRRKHEMTSLPSTTTTTESTKDHQIYRRSRSETKRLDMRRDFRRSMRRFCEMDDLSNDEFRSTVETFIAGKKKKIDVVEGMVKAVRYY